MHKAIAAALCLVGLSTAAARADCNQSSLRGTYVYFAIDAVTVPDDGPVVASFPELCVFDIDTSGMIEQTNCIQEFEGTTFAINSDCKIDLESNLGCEYVGQLSRDRNLAPGTAFCPRVGDFAFNLYFNLVRVTEAGQPPALAGEVPASAGEAQALLGGGGKRQLAAKASRSKGD